MAEIDDERSCILKEKGQDVEKTTSSLPQTSFNYINSIIGSGVIGLPYAIQRSGFGLGIMLLLLVALITDYSLILMVKGAHLSGASSYQGLVEAAFGYPGFLMLTTLQFFYPFIAMVSYNVIVGDTVTKVIIRLTGIAADSFFARREFIIFVATLLITIPLSLFRDIARLSKVSLLSLIFIIVIFISILFRMTTMQYIIPATVDAWQFSNSGVFQATGIMAFAFMCHHNTFLLYESLREATPERWVKVTHISILSSVVVCLLIGIGGYATFTGYVQGDLLENYCWHDDLMNTVRFLFSITILLTFPIETFVAREVVENALFCRYSKPSPLWRHVVVTVAIVAIAFFLSLTTDCLGIVLELNGIVAAVPLAFVLPSIAYCRLEEGSYFSRKKLPALIVAIFGMCVAVVGVIQVVTSQEKAGSNCSHGLEMSYCMTKNGTQVPL